MTLLIKLLLLLLSWSEVWVHFVTLKLKFGRNLSEYHKIASKKLVREIPNATAARSVFLICEHWKLTLPLFYKYLAGIKIQNKQKRCRQQNVLLVGLWEKTAASISWIPSVWRAAPGILYCILYSVYCIVSMGWRSLPFRFLRSK